MSVGPAIGVAPLAAEDGGIVDDIVGMLDAGLSEEIVLEWLGTQPEALLALSAEEMIALRQAGATDALLSALLDRVGRPSGPASSPPQTEPEHARVGVSGTATDRSPHAAAVAVPVSFEIEYLARFDDSDPEWDLYVYLDGIPLTYLTSGSLMDPGRLRFARQIESGRHVVRLAQERHEKRRKSWEHHSRVVPLAFEFEIAPSGPAKVSIEFHQRMIDFNDPVTVVVQQGNRVLDSGRVGGDYERWPALCEDVWASVPDGKEPSRSERERLESCLDWSELWSGLEVPSRESVLEAMAQFDFQPVPKGT